MQTRRVNFESLESRQLLNSAPISVAQSAVADTSGSSATSGLVRYIRNGDLVLNSNSSEPTTESTPQHWPSEQIRSEWKPEFAADFNGDGLTDVMGQVAPATANGNQNAASAWLQVNDGEQLFLLPWGDGLPIGTHIAGSGDVDGDGLADIVSFDPTTNEVWVSMNSLDNGFQNQLWTRWSTPIDTQPFVGDFDHDGLTDVLVGARDGSWLLGRSTGSRFASQPWGRFVDYNWQDMVIGDFNGDAFPDIAARAPDRTWWMWQGAETGLERAAYAGHWKMGTEWYDVQVADFNADGLDDVIGRTDEGKLFVGTSMPKEDGQPSFRTWRWTKGWIFSAAWHNVSIVDITGDGLPDQIGQAKDGTWWLAENIGENFKNSFFDRHRNVDFVAVMDNAQHVGDAEPLHVLGNIPASVATSTVNSQANSGVLANPHQPLRVSINENDELVLRGSGMQIRAVEFQSASGSLVPLRGIDPSFGFNQVASNDAVNVRLSTLSTVTIDGELVLGVKWDPTSSAQDLVVKYDAVDLPAIVDGQVFAAVSPTIDPKTNNADSYSSLYADAVQWRPFAPEEEPTLTASAVEPEPSPAETVEPDASQPEAVEPEVNEPQTSEPEIVEPPAEEAETTEQSNPEVEQSEGDSLNAVDSAESEEPADEPQQETNEPQQPTTDSSTEQPTEAVEQDAALSLSLSEDNLFQIDATDELVYALRIESPTHSLIPGDSPAPFDEVLVSDSGLVVYAAEEPVSFSEITQLDLGWKAETTSTEQLIAEFANLRTNWLPAWLFGDRLSVSKTTELPDIETPVVQELTITLDQDNFFVVTANQENVLGMNFISKAGGLTPGTSPKPFEIFVSNTPKQVTLGTWGTLVTISGDITLDVGWNSDFDLLADLDVEYGDEFGQVHLAKVMFPVTTPSAAPTSEPTSSRPSRG